VRCERGRTGTIPIDKEKAASREGVIIHELYLYAAIRFLARASFTDICFFCRISKSAFYCILRCTIHAINLAILVSFPTSPEDCAALAADFEKKIYNGVISNCVGALDGYLLQIETPHKKHARNVQSYFSGHYQRYGVNIQACCDAHCRFTFLGIGGPGVTKDRTGASRDCGLYDLVENLPPGYICIGDCAYEATE
jgi:DDE superfamily endonuclease